MAKKRGLDIEIDNLTNSITNVVTGEVFETEFNKLKGKDIKKKDWLFDWHKELKDENKLIYKMTTVENKNIIQGLISYEIDTNFIFINLVETARFNRSKQKMYEGVGGNLFAFACKTSKDLGFEGFVSFIAKTSLLEHYNRTLGASKTIGNRMVIIDDDAEILIDRYFKKK